MSKNEVGKIYCLRSNESNKIYVGSTFQKYLCNRLAKHKFSYKAYLNNKYHYVTSFELLKNDNCYTELISEHQDVSKEMLRKFEGEEIRKQKDICVNKRIEDRTSKEYRFDNTDKIRNDKQQHRITNLDKIKQYEKQYRIINNDKLKVDKQNYYNNNVEKLTQKFVCDICGGQYTYQHKQTHIKTKKHIQKLD